MSHTGPLRIVTIGQGYVGLPLSVALSEAGHHVVGYDTDKERVRLLGDACVPEALERLRRVLASGHYRPTDDPECLRQAEVVIICVPTPLDAAERSDPSAVLEVARLLAVLAPPETLVVLESTVAPGFVEGPFARELGPSRHRVAYAPERIDPGPGRRPLPSIPRLVSGLTPEAAEAAAALYRPLGIPVHIVPVPIASWAKLLENTFRLVNVALVDEFATACGAAGVDIDAVIAAAATKPFGFVPFHSGPGAGGHCIPVDPVYLVDHLNTLGLDLPLVRAALAANAERPRSVARGIAARMPGGRPGKVLLVGVTYKADVADTRMTAARPIRELLRALGHEVGFHDPLVLEFDGQRSTPLTEEAVRAVDIIAVLVAHRGLDLGPLITAGRPVLDACGALARSGGAQVIRI
jgi:UDP-N-acetyl-D-glucosamine dehydrogenase